VPKDFQVMFLDMNSYFASVEQQVQPSLRGKPVGVAPYLGPNGCIIAASREAKAVGVRTGCLVQDAKRIYPKIKIVESRPALYVIYHNAIKKVIESFTPYFQPLSIDEFAIFLTPRDQNEYSSIKLAKNIKSKMYEEVGDFLSCSIGIGPNRFLAKVAGETKKPDGLTLVKLSELDRFYSQLKLRDLTGINYRMESRLLSKNIKSPLEFYQTPLWRLRDILDHFGRLWHFRLRGYEVDDYVSETKNVGHSHVLPPEFRTRHGAETVLRKLIFKTGARLRKDNFIAGGIYVSVHFYNKGSFSQSKKTPKFNDNLSFEKQVFEILKKCDWRGMPSYVSVAAFNLSQTKNIQISIFKDIEKSRELSRALDNINDEYGLGTIHMASMLEALETAPDRIPFGKPRYDIRC